MFGMFNFLVNLFLFFCISIYRFVVFFKCLFSVLLFGCIFSYLFSFLLVDFFVVFILLLFEVLCESYGVYVLVFF